MSWRTVLTASCAVVIVGAALVWDALLHRDLNPGVDRALTQPIRLRVENPGAYREFLLGLRVHHYRVQSRRIANFVDVYYDTPAGDLFNHGFSYRFRRRLGANDHTTYSVRLEQEPRFVSRNSKKIDVRSRVPTPLGDTIANGKWDRAISGAEGLAAPARLHTLLQTLEIDSKRLGPRLVGELYRERFDVTDKGRNWFQLDHEIWTFRPFDELAASPILQYEDIVLDTRLAKGNPELLRRVRTMYQFANMIDGVRLSKRVPHERATETLTIHRLSSGAHLP